MATAMSQVGSIQPYSLDPKHLSSQKVARAASDVESALAALASALREGAQLRALEILEGLKRRVGYAEVGVESLIARVPALGPLLAMGMYRATHPSSDEEDMPTRPSNVDDLSVGGVNSMLAYLESIGC